MPVASEFGCVIDLCSVWSQSYSSLCYRTEPRQTPLSTGFSLPGKNSAVDCHFLLQGIFPT